MKSWTKTETGYEALEGRAVVTQKGRTWILTLDGTVYDLGRHASFDYAEGIIVHVQAEEMLTQERGTK